VLFRNGQRKDNVMTERLRTFVHEEGIVFIGKAQEKTPVFRAEKRHSPHTGRPYPWIVKSTAMVNHYYIYAVDRDFGPFFLKFCTYFPYNGKLCLNGHEYATRQLAHEGTVFQALDNGIQSCADPQRLQEICDGLPADKIDALLRKWLERLPHPFTPADRHAGYRYDLSILQAEFSLTQVLDRPVHGRLFFEQVVRENLDLGRPEEVQLIFNRRITRATPGCFRTRILTQGVTSSLHVYYKSARIKQYHKEQRALRTETTINNTYDFRIGKRLGNLPKLREIGFAANRRLLEVERLSHDCILADDTFQKINSPIALNGQRASGLRFADPRVHPLWHALILFRLLANGFRSADLRNRRPWRPHPRDDRAWGNDLSASSPTPPRHDRTRPPQPPLSRHRCRLPNRPLLHPNLQPPLAPRSGRGPPRPSRRHHPAQALLESRFLNRKNTI
jgi:hypothetical protein